MVKEEKLHPRKILLAIDGSEHAFSATQLLKNINLPGNTEITAMAVLVPRQASQHAALKSAVSQVKDILESKNVSVTTNLVAGYPAEQISMYAEEFDPDLIVLGAKGLRATLGIFLGGVAQQIVESSECPVLVVRKGYTTMKNVLFATDGSQSSIEAEDYLVSFSFPEDVRIHIMHVLPALVSEDMLLQTWPVGMEMVPVIPTEELTASLEKQAEEEKKKGEEVLAKSVEHFTKAGFRCNKMLKRGDAATEIIKYAEEHNIDTIVVASKGIGAFKSWLLGSVSRKLVHYAPCSVMVVKSAGKS